MSENGRIKEGELTSELFGSGVISPVEAEDPDLFVVNKELIGAAYLLNELFERVRVLRLKGRGEYALELEKIMIEAAALGKVPTE